MFHFLVRRHALSPSTQLRRLFFSTVSSSSTSGTTASSEPHCLVEYLVNTCGFSAEDASKVSKSLPRSFSTERADAVVGFFRSKGLDGANLRKQITWRPELLCSDVETKLAPRFNVLCDMGLSESDAINVLKQSSFILSLNVQTTLLPRLKNWESLFGSREILLKNLRRKYRFMSSSIENVVLPNLNFLRDECGIPEDRVSLVIKKHPSFIAQSPDALRALVDRAEGIGITRGSVMFIWILDALHRVSRDKFEAHVKLMNSLGFSNSDFITAFKKFPKLLAYSTKSLQRKMEFFVNDVGFSSSFILSRPTLLGWSLEKRLIPRFRVMEILISEGLLKSTNKQHTIFSLSDKFFLEKYVLPYKDKVPKLLQVLPGVAEFKGNNPNCE